MKVYFNSIFTIGIETFDWLFGLQAYLTYKFHNKYIILLFYSIILGFYKLLENTNKMYLNCFFFNVFTPTQYLNIIIYNAYFY